MEPGETATVNRPVLRPRPTLAEGWAAIERLIRHLGWLGFFVCMSPLGPRDYGLVALALAGIAMLESLLVELAVGALLALERVEEAHLSTAFLANTGAGAVVSLVLYALGGEISVMFDEPGLGDVFQTLALLPVLSALTAVPVALLNSTRSAAPLASSALIGVATGGAVGMTLAGVGGGAWSLVAQIVTQRFIEIAVLWGSAGRLFALRWSWRHLEEIAHAVTPATLGPVCATIARQMPRFLIGLILGPIAAGLYLPGARVAEAIAEVCAAPARAAGAAWLGKGGAGPAMPALLRWAALRAGAATIVAMVASAFLLEPVMAAWLDPRWWGAVRPAQILVLAVGPAALQQVRRLALLGANRQQAEGLWLAAQTATSMLAVAAAVSYGLEAVAGAELIQASAVAALGLWPVAALIGTRPPLARAGLLSARLAPLFRTAALVGFAVLACGLLLLV